MKMILALLALLSLSTFAQTVRGTPPSYCHPCLFYGGDFDPNGPNPNAVTNCFAFNCPTSTVYVPFYIPSGQKWVITGLFSNNAASVDTIDPKQIQWSLSTGVSVGNPGTLIASGTAWADWIPTGRTWESFAEYTAIGHLTPQSSVTLTGPAVYWMSAVPLCTPGSRLCQSANYFITDVEDIPAPNHKGLQPNDDSYVNDPFGGSDYAPTWGPSGVCDGVGCDKFSAGLLGYAKPSN